MRDVVAWIVLLGPPLVLLTDAAIWRCCGGHCTITAIVRCWADESAWPEMLYVLGAAILYLHLFRNWPERFLYGP